MSNDIENKKLKEKIREDEKESYRIKNKEKQKRKKYFVNGFDDWFY